MRPFYPIISALVIFQLAALPSCNAQKKKAPPVASSQSIKASENKSKAIDVSDYFNGFNAQMMRGPEWQAPGFINRVKELYPGTLRYPGGTVANYWDWKTGWLMKNVARREWTNIPENPIKLEDLKFACDQTGAAPLLVLNMLNSNLPSQLEMLRQAKRIGLDVKFIELGNEFYLGESDYVQKFPSGRDYAVEANKWIAEIKKEFPGVRIAVVGYSVKEGASKKEAKHAGRTNNWNQQVLSVISGADAMTFHIYGGTGLNYISKVRQAEQDDEEPGNEKAAQMQQAFEKQASRTIVMGVPFNRFSTSARYDYQLLPKGMKAWITEYNMFEREGVVAGTWAHGLYAITQTLLFLEQPATELVCYHSLVTSAQFGAIFHNSDGFARAFKKTKNNAFDFSASGYALSLAGKALSDAGRANQLNFQGAGQLTGARGQKYPALNGWVIKRKSGKRIIVTNLSSGQLQVDFSEVIHGGSFTQISSDPVKQVASNADINKQTGQGSLITLAPYSVTLIEGE